MSTAQRVAQRLKASGGMIVTAESCTGGWVAQELTAIAGSSNWFDRGFVTYSNEAKQEMLGVRADTLRRHGAVSEETAREMAQGALGRGRGTVALSITGIAGPTGGTAEKPVGTVCFGWATKQGAMLAETKHFPGDREAVRRQSVEYSLAGVLRLLDEAG
ncbi:MAG TPA: nicotinamide-nucleotide amidase [Burkholderiales bacterium]|nr:nicotinamide-nucleotide amidase [Burkholderiales bacterium]